MVTSCAAFGGGGKAGENGKWRQERGLRFQDSFQIGGKSGRDSRQNGPGAPVRGNYPLTRPSATLSRLGERER